MALLRKWHFTCSSTEPHKAAHLIKENRQFLFLMFWSYSFCDRCKSFHCLQILMQKWHFIEFYGTTQSCSSRKISNPKFSRFETFDGYGIKVSLIKWQLRTVSTAEFGKAKKPRSTNGTVELSLSFTERSRNQSLVTFTKRCHKVYLTNERTNQYEWPIYYNNIMSNSQMLK